MIIIVNGPSGSGKTTLVNHLTSLGLNRLITTTTRKPRDGEVHGVSYYFVTEEEFFSAERIEESCYAGNWYGLTVKEAEGKLKGSVSAVATLDINGVRSLKKLYGDQVLVIFLKVSRRKLKQRMYRRGDSIGDIRKRLDHHRAENEHLNEAYADYVIVNKGSIRRLEAAGRRILEQEGLLP